MQAVDHDRMWIVAVVFLPISKRGQDRPVFEHKPVPSEAAPVLIDVEFVDALDEVRCAISPTLIHLLNDAVCCCSCDRGVHCAPPSSSRLVMPIAQ